MIMAKKIIEFQEDLKSGMTIEKALQKHELTFKEACERCPKPFTRKPAAKRDRTRCSPAKYIQRRKNKYYLRKNIKGSTKIFGVYSSLEDAITIRDELERYGWKQKSVDGLCAKNGVERIEGKVTRTRYH